MSRRYRVAVPWNGLASGDELAADAFPGTNFPALVAGGVLEPITPRVECPACREDKRVKKTPAFEKAETFADHYATEHKALAAPDFEGVIADGD